MIDEPDPKVFAEYRRLLLQDTEPFFGKTFPEFIKHPTIPENSFELQRLSFAIREIRYIFFYHPRHGEYVFYELGINRLVKDFSHFMEMLGEYLVELSAALKYGFDIEFDISPQEENDK